MHCRVLADIDVNDATWVRQLPLWGWQAGRQSLAGANHGLGYYERHPEVQDSNTGGCFLDESQASRF